MLKIIKETLEQKMNGCKTIKSEVQSECANQEQFDLLRREAQIHGWDFRDDARYQFTVRKDEKIYCFRLLKN